tara:strand:+ start:1252 stop:1479 length:228 start_codon:yes stop_codon:yes gene_type:complete
MDRYEVMAKLENFAIEIGADKTTPFMQSKIVMGVGRSIKLIEEAIHEKIGDDFTTEVGKEYTTLIDEINEKYVGI